MEFEFFQTWSRWDGTIGGNSEYRKAVVRSVGKGSGNCSEHAGGHLSTRRREITRRFAKKTQCAASQVSEMDGESDCLSTFGLHRISRSLDRDSVIQEIFLFLVKN